MLLLPPQVCCPRAGEELTISYGDKGNEELLLLYGFAQPSNSHETLMLLCPLPSPEDWDEVFTARMELLQVIGLCRGGGVREGFYSIGVWFRRAGGKYTFWGWLIVHGRTVEMKSIVQGFFR